MPTPSIYGDPSEQVTAVLAFSTSTAISYIRTSDTGTVVSTSRTVDLSRALHLGVTGGKPLDATIHRRPAGPPRWKAVKVSVPLELVFHSSGQNVFVTVAHKHRAAASGAGSTWATLKTDVRRFRMGTDTDATFHVGVVSSANLQAVARFYKANITYSFRKASSTSAKDTTTNSELIANSPVLEFYGGDMPQVSVPGAV